MDKRKIILISTIVGIVIIVAAVTLWFFFVKKQAGDVAKPKFETYPVEGQGQKEQFHSSFVLVKYKESVSEEEIKKFESDEKLKLIRKSRSTGVTRYQTEDGSTENVEIRVARFKTLPLIESAEKDATTFSDYVPNDPFYQGAIIDQWHITGSLSGGVRMQDVWDQQTANNSVVVAVLDTGVAYENYTDPNPANCYPPISNPCMPAGTAYQKATDLLGTAFWVNTGETAGDGIDNDGNGYIDDTNGWDFVNNDNHPNDGMYHGTFVTGVIAQTTNNSVGAAGAAFGVTIMPVKVLPDKGSGSGFDVNDGIYYAADNGADVINLSLGSSVFSAAEEAAINYANTRGVVVVASTGNDGVFTERYPASYINTIAVGAANSSKNRACYSNSSSNIDIIAPGGQNYIEQCQSQATLQGRGCPLSAGQYYCTSSCCTLFDVDGDSYEDGILQQGFTTNTPTAFGYYFGNGTSYSAPIISAAAALLLSRDPSLTPAQVKSYLETTADDLGPVGWDTENGAGFVNILSALAAVTPAACVDTDADGYGNPASALCTQPTLDCNNTNAAIHPGAVDICGNGVDEDCSGADAVCAAVCTDTDSDGYGNPASATCANPTLDCNDSAPAIHPGAAEICGNGIDENCNGSDLACPAVCGNNVGEGTEECDGTDLRSQTCTTRGFTGGSLSCVAAACTFDTSACTSPPPCIDGDSDGYGNPASATCTFPTLDCNDTSSSVHPSAPDICGNTIDEDCNGSDAVCAVGALGFANWQFVTGTEERCDPVIQSVVPATRSYDDLVGVAINGYNFGTIADEAMFLNTNFINDLSDICLNSTLLDTGGASAQCIQNWGSTLIRSRVPARGGTSNGSITGDVKIRVAGVESNGMPLGVTSPHINSLSPVSAPVGQWVTLNGVNFGITPGTVRFIRRSDGVMFNGNFPCGSTGWGDTRIIVEFPVDSNPFIVGDALEIQIERSDGIHGNFGSFNVTAGTPGPGICTLAPSCGPTGTSVDITGKRFGATQGTSAITFNQGASSTPPTGIGAWGDESITGVIVPTLADNMYGVKVTVGGVDSNSLSFDVPCGGRPGVAESATCATGLTQSPSPYLNTTGVPNAASDACINTGAISARFTEDMDESMLTDANIDLLQCTGYQTGCTNIPAASITILNFDTVNEGFMFTPSVPLVADTWYQGLIRGVVTNEPAAGGLSMGTDYRWDFHVAAGSAACPVSTLIVNPSTATVTLPASVNYVATPLSANCNLLGAASYTYAWTDGPHSTLTLPPFDSSNETVSADSATSGTPDVITAGIPAESVTGTANLTINNALSCADTGLIGVWKFDEQSGDVAIDSSSSGANDGILTSSSARSSTGCRFGSCLNLNGTDQYAAVNPSLLNFGTSNFTVEGWIKTAGAVSSQTLVSKQESGDQPGYTLDVASTGIAFFRVNPAGVPPPDRVVLGAKLVNNNAWHHIAGVRTGSTIKLYVDGNLDGSSTSTSTANVDSIYSTLIGAYGDPTIPASLQNFVNGQVDEVRVWNKALAPSEIRSIYNQSCQNLSTISCSDPNLKAVWKLNEGTGIVASDSSANNNDGQLNNSPTWKDGTDAIGCKFGKCLEFDGTDDNVDVGTGFTDSIESAGTIEAWVYRTGTTGGIFSRSTGSSWVDERLVVFFRGDTNEWGWSFSDGVGASNESQTMHRPVTDFPLNTWTHMALTWNSATVTTYINGISVDSRPQTEVPEVTGTKTRIGWNEGIPGGNWSFAGRIDEPRVWDKALTQEEIISAMSQSCLVNPAALGALSCTSDVVGLWNFDEAGGSFVGDGSRNRNNGILLPIQTGSWATACQFGSCLRLNGTTQYIDVPDAPSLNFGDGTNDRPFTISAWVNRETLTAGVDEVILSKYNSQASPRRQQYLFDISGGGLLRVAIFDPHSDQGTIIDQRRGIQTTTSTTSGSGWSHVAATYDGSKTNAGFKLFVDGVQQTTSVLYDEALYPSYVAMEPTSESLKIGRNTDSSAGANYFSGSIDEVRVYNRALSVSEITNTYQKSMTACVEATLYCTDPRLTGVWKFDEGIGVVAGDSTSNNLDGTFGVSPQNPQWLTGATNCKFGSCLDFNAGEGDYVAIADSPKLNFGTNSFTIEGWVRYTATVRERIVSKYSTNNGYDLVTDNGIIQFSVCELGACDVVNSTTAANTGNWVHITAVRDRPTGQLRLYLNNNPPDTTTDTGKSTSYAGALYFGREQNSPFYYFSGVMDEFRIWNKSLSDTEIAGI